MGMPPTAWPAFCRLNRPLLQIISDEMRGSAQLNSDCSQPHDMPARQMFFVSIF
jgi:hypothetical protein